MNILDKILIEKEKEVSMLKNKSFKQIEYKRPPTLYESMLHSTQMNIIAEIKRSSPSQGPIQMNVDPVSQAKEYEALGAVAISVLTDETFFNGSIDDLRAIRKEVNIPILCKDFIIHPIQIDRAKAAGANIILLIVAALDHKSLTSLYQYARKLNLEVLVEVHHELEMQKAIELGARLIGINNRDLKTFQVDLGTTTRLASMIQDPETILISESGIRTKEDVMKVNQAGAKGILVGETLMRAKDLKGSFVDLTIPIIGG